MYIYMPVTTCTQCGGCRIYIIISRWIIGLKLGWNVAINHHLFLYLKEYIDSKKYMVVRNIRKGTSYINMNCLQHKNWTWSETRDQDKVIPRRAQSKTRGKTQIRLKTSLQGKKQPASSIGWGISRARTNRARVTTAWWKARRTSSESRHREDVPGKKDNNQEVHAYLHSFRCCFMVLTGHGAVVSSRWDNM